MMRPRLQAGSRAGEHAVRLEAVGKVYGKGAGAVLALRGVWIALPYCTFTAVMGPSGSGKSTLLQTAAGLDRPTGGRAQVTRMIRWEVLGVVGLGELLGLAIAAATLVPFSLATAATAVPYLPWKVVAGVLAGAVMLGLVASELLTRNLLRQDPMVAIGPRQ